MTPNRPFEFELQPTITDPTRVLNISDTLILVLHVPLSFINTVNAFEQMRAVRILITLVGDYQILLRINVPFIPSKVKPINRIIFPKGMGYPLSLWVRELIIRDIQMHQNPILLKKCANLINESTVSSLGLIAFAKQIPTKICDPQVVTFELNIENFFASQRRQ
jgi:hypothetical protein